MRDRVVYSGSKVTIEFAELPNGRMPACEFVEQQDRRCQARLYALFQRLGETQRIHNELQFKKLEGAFWEFKADGVRLICFFAGNRLLILTNGFKKKSRKTPSNELVRASHIMRDCVNLKFGPTKA
jgi:phage-related protein